MALISGKNKYIKDLKDMNKKLSPIFNEMVGKALDMQKITENHAGTVRIIEPGQTHAKNMDMTRLTVYIDDKNIVDGINFG